jgi:addiction module HigA family antidote
MATKTKRRLPAIHPGEILREDFMRPLKLSMNRLALELRVPVTRIADIVNGKRGMTADTALRLGRYFNMNARFWMNLQMLYELELAERKGAAQVIQRQVHPIQASA